MSQSLSRGSARLYRSWVRHIPGAGRARQGDEQGTGGRRRGTAACQTQLGLVALRALAWAFRGLGFQEGGGSSCLAAGDRIPGHRAVIAWSSHRAGGVGWGALMRTEPESLGYPLVSRDCSCPSLPTPHFLCSPKANKRIEEVTCTLLRCWLGIGPQGFRHEDPSNPTPVTPPDLSQTMLNLRKFQANCAELLMPTNLASGLHHAW